MTLTRTIVTSDGKGNETAEVVELTAADIKAELTTLDSVLPRHIEDTMAAANVDFHPSSPLAAIKVRKDALRGHLIELQTNTP